VSGASVYDPRFPLTEARVTDFVDVDEWLGAQLCPGVPIQAPNQQPKVEGDRQSGSYSDDEAHRHALKTRLVSASS